MDRIEKALKKLSLRERDWVKEILGRLARGDTKGLDLKKLKGRGDVFRVRKGDIRVVYRVDRGTIFLLTIERRGGRTYE